MLILQIFDSKCYKTWHVSSQVVLSQFVWGQVPPQPILWPVSSLRVRIYQGVQRLWSKGLTSWLCVVPWISFTSQIDISMTTLYFYFPQKLLEDPERGPFHSLILGALERVYSSDQMISGFNLQQSRETIIECGSCTVRIFSLSISQLFYIYKIIYFP